MAALPSEEDLEYLWRPKRTLRDWGETNYNIVRNWTPHSNKMGPPTSSSKLTNKSKSSVTKFSSTKKLPSSTKVQTSFQGEPLMTTSYRLRRSTRKQQSIANCEASWYVPGDAADNINDQSISCSSLELNPGNEGGNKISRSELTHGDTRSSRMSSSESPSALLSLSHTSGTSDRQLLSSNSIEVDVASWPIQEGGSYSGSESEGEKKSAPVQQPDNEDSISEDADDEEDMAPEEETSEAEPMDCEDNMDTSTQPSSSKKSTGTQKTLSGTKSRKSITTGDGKKAASRHLKRSSEKRNKTRTTGKDNESARKVQAKGVTRTTADLTDLEGCGTVYDRIVKEAVTESDNEVVQHALVSHWKGTQKQLLSVIKDLHSVNVCEKRPTKGKTKHSQRQKEALSVLKKLQRNNREYHDALAKVKQEKQRQALDVERQIAAVGLLLQSESAS